MAGIGRNPRHGKRPSSSSSSSYFSTVTMVVFVAFCILGVWMLTSSSIIPSQSTTTTTHHHSRTTVSSSDPPPSRLFRREPPPDSGQGDSEQAEEEEGEDKPGSKLSVDSLETIRQPGSGQGDQEKGAAEEETQLESEAGVGESTNNQRQEEYRNEEGGTQQEERGGNEESHEHQSLENREAEEGNPGYQQTSDQNADGGNGENQQQSVSQGEETQLQSEQQEIDSQINEEQQNSQEKKQEMESEEQENQQEMLQQQQQQQMGANNEENQQEKQQQEMGEHSEENQQEIQEEQKKQIWSNDEEKQQETQQENQTEIDENHDQIQQQTDEGTSGSHLNPEEQTEDGANETQSQTEPQTYTEGSREEQQQENSRQQTEDESTIATSDEGQQQGEEKFTDPNASDSLPDGSESEVPNEIDGQNRPWATQADQSENEKERRMGEEPQSNEDGGSGTDIGNLYGHDWELCNVTAGPDYIPCLDNVKAIKQLHGIKHYEHRERHCPEESPTCLVPLPKGYKRSIEWPKSRDRIWYNNVPHTKLAEVKGHQNWVKVTGQYLTFPGGGTQFIHGALHYIDFIQQSVHDIAWGKHTRVILDVGCGVASFGGYLFERDVIAMSFAPKDEHEAQVQLALERGIPAISAVMGSQRLPFPSRVFDLVHCARCRVPWHADGGALLLELNRVLRPGGYFVWSATPVYQKLKEDVEIWKAMKSLTISMCWDLFTIKKDRLNSVGAAFFRKPVSNECYDNRKHHSPPMCKEDDDPNAAWYIPMKTCMHRAPVDPSERGSQWPDVWPRRLQVPPYWLNSSQVGVYGRPAPDDFTSDYEHWKRVVMKSYLNDLGINWSKVRNVMDMRAVYGGFAAALKGFKVWVMNVVNIDSPDTLPIIFERGLFGIYHDWCESFSTYPRTYDLLHADHLFSQLKNRCSIVPVIAEVDRIVRPGGKLIVRDEPSTVREVEGLLKSLHWEVRLTFSKDQEGILCAEKSDWRPDEKFSDSS